MAKLCLEAGADDFGGTLMNESISTAAGAGHGHFLRPADIRAAVRETGRVPVERTTTYQVRRVFEHEPERPDRLDEVEQSGALFGSYQSLISSGQFRC
jgi:5-amino-6-(D-ribitylamino)uracil---L-tyrosine 4-hydroxyphenyl transferase